VEDDEFLGSQSGKVMKVGFTREEAGVLTLVPAA
jgi:hypothetical protein